MRLRDLSNVALFRAKRIHGYAGSNSNIVSMWRNDQSAIGSETVPVLMGALGMTAEERRLWALHFLYERLPDLVDVMLGHEAGAPRAPNAGSIGHAP